MLSKSIIIAALTFAAAILAADAPLDVATLVAPGDVPAVQALLKYEQAHSGDVYRRLEASGSSYVDLALVDGTTDKMVYSIKLDRTPALGTYITRLQDECCLEPDSSQANLQSPLNDAVGGPPGDSRCAQFRSTSADCNLDAACPSCYHVESPNCRYQKCCRAKLPPPAM
jgi:hypothetical protein